MNGNEHPQIRAYENAAESLRNERYYLHDTGPDQAAFLRALGDVLSEVAYQLDKYRVFPDEAMQAFRDSTNLPIPAMVSTSAEVILMGSLQKRIQVAEEADE